MLSAAKRKKTGKPKKILLIAHDMQIAGAEIILYNLTKILVDSGYSCSIISLNDGPMIEKFKVIGCKPKILSSDFDKYPDKIIQYARCFDLVIANTIVTYRAVWYMKDYVKFIWLIHEALCFETDLFKFYSVAHYGCPSIVDILKNVGKIYTVSEYSKKVFSKYTDNIDVIYNGLEDDGRNLISEKRENQTSA